MQDVLIKYDFRLGIEPKHVKKDLITQPSLIIIRNFPKEDHHYENFVKELGAPVHEYRNNRGKGIFEVKVLGKERVFKSLANSNLQLPLHTDCSDFEKIPNCIGLLCIQNSDKGGKSTFAFLERILEELDKEQIAYLLTKVWNFRKQKRSILTKTTNEYKICYDRILIESFSKLNVEEIKSLIELDKIFEKCMFTLKLNEGDLIIFRNDLILHGREKFDLNPNRLIKRIRFNLEQ